MKPGIYFHSIFDVSPDVIRALNVSLGSLAISSSARYFIIVIDSTGSFQVHLSHSVPPEALPLSLDQVKELALLRQLEM